jgi:hypothetical protein
MEFPRDQFAAALATTFHPQMEVQAVDYLTDHFLKAVKEIGWSIHPMANGAPSRRD